MTNPRIKAILNEAIKENRQEDNSEKLFLIEDIIKVKKVLFGMGHVEHNEFLSAESAGKLFDDLYELDIIALELVLNNYSQIVTKLVKERIRIK